MVEHTSTPEFILPKSVQDFDIDQFDKLLADLRERRLKAVAVYEAAQAAIKAAHAETATETLVKQTHLLAASLDRIEEMVIKAEARAVKVRVLRLELGLD